VREVEPALDFTRWNPVLPRTGSSTTRSRPGTVPRRG